MFRFITSPQPKGTPDKIVLVNFCQGWASVCPHEEAAKVLSRKLGVPLEPRPVMNSGELAALGVTYRDTPAAWRNYRS